MLHEDQTQSVTDDQSATPTNTEEAQATPETSPDATPSPEASAAPDAEPTPAPAAVEPAPEVATAVETTATVAEPAKAPPAPAPADNRSDAELFEAALAELSPDVPGDKGHRKLAKGDRVEATVIHVETDRVFVDLGTKSEGVIPLNELAEGPVDDAKKIINVGDKVNVIVIKPEGRDENAIVSKKKADFEATWYKVIDAFQNQETITAQVVDRVKGGLVVDLGVRGFVPATHVGNGKLRNLEKYVGQPLEVKIIELDRERKKVVLSNRVAEDQRREAVKDQLFDEVKAGQVVEGTVRRLADYGAFVDLGGIDGLLHISEMSWMRISHPKEVLKEGQSVKVMVLRLDSETGKISLGLRQVLPDPWNLIRENYKVGQRFNCSITRLVQSGAFVRLPEEAEAFLPVSEISNRRIAKPGDVLTEGQEVEVVVIDLRPDERRMVLSLRAAGTAIDPPEGYVVGDFEESRGRKAGGKRPGGMGGGKRPGGKGRGRSDDDDVESLNILGRTPTAGATIGERLGALKGLLGGGSKESAPPAAKEAPAEASEEPTGE